MSFHINLLLMQQEENEHYCYGACWIFNYVNGFSVLPLRLFLSLYKQPLTAVQGC